MKALHGMSTINVELTSRCNKSCWMCGRRKQEKEFPEIAQNYGDMDFALVEMIAEQLPPGIVVQFHNNGEPLLYPRFGDAVRLFENQIRCVDTNAKLIVEKADEIIANLSTITISVIPNDKEADEQYELVQQFLLMKGNYPPRVIIRCLKMHDESDSQYDRWKNLKQLIAWRTVHNPLGSFDYKKPRVIPEIGICTEALHHPAIDRFGNMSACVRFDPKGLLIYGQVWEGIDHLWNMVSQGFKKAHIEGRRNELSYCKKCEYWGCPS